MAGTLPGSLEVQAKLPLDAKYWVDNSQITTLNTGLLSAGLLRFSKSDDTLWIYLSTGWKKVPLDATGSSTTLTIGTVSSGISAAASITDNKLNLVLPKGQDGITGTLNIERVELSPDKEPHIVNIGDKINANYIIQLPFSANNGRLSSIYYLKPIDVIQDGQQIIDIPSAKYIINVWKDEYITTINSIDKYYRSSIPNELWSFSNNTLTINASANILTKDKVSAHYTISYQEDGSNDHALPPTNTYNTTIVPVSHTNGSSTSYYQDYKSLRWTTDARVTPLSFTDTLSTNSSPNPSSMLVYSASNPSDLLGKLDFNGADANNIKFSIEFPAGSGTIYTKGKINNSSTISDLVFTNGSIILVASNSTTNA